VSKPRWFCVIVLALAVVAAGIARASGPSFDCHKAKKWSDMMVCGNPNLADLDGKVDKAYRKAQRSLPPKDAQQVREVQQAWLKGREKCQEDPDPMKCLQTYYERRIKEIVQPGQ
jgi:uncharacterized protein